VLTLHVRNCDDEREDDYDDGSYDGESCDHEGDHHAVDCVGAVWTCGAVHRRSGGGRADDINVDGRAAWRRDIGDYAVRTRVYQVEGDVRSERFALHTTAAHRKRHVDDVMGRQTAPALAHAHARSMVGRSRHDRHRDGVRPLKAQYVAPQPRKERSARRVVHLVEVDLGDLHSVRAVIT